MCKNAAMTYSTLSGIYKDITRREDKLARLRSQACVTSARLDKPTGGSGYYDRIGSLAAEIADLEGELETLRESYKAALDALGSDSLAASGAHIPCFFLVAKYRRYNHNRRSKCPSFISSLIVMLYTSWPRLLNRRSEIRQRIFQNSYQNHQQLSRRQFGMMLMDHMTKYRSFLQKSHPRFR